MVIYFVLYRGVVDVVSAIGRVPRPYRRAQEDVQFCEGQLLTQGTD